MVYALASMKSILLLESFLCPALPKRAPIAATVQLFFTSSNLEVSDESCPGFNQIRERPAVVVIYE